ncbi:alpha/beta hydrolase [Corynebacterium pseudopelargi]|uniref:alpha/beta hydrolase n=1 Tax=Corynebacterium pseudopelargi TaxID=2080757 RepID=UPI001FEB64D9|nr:alpha/beta hydrolase [Corynebacterium pseudopelargi]
MSPSPLTANLPSAQQRFKRKLSPKVVAFEGDFQHQMLHTRGVRLHAATAGDPSDPLVLLLHDSFGGWFDFRHVIAPLAQKGFHVAAIDMRGYGMSDKPPQGYAHREAVGDLLGCISTLGHNQAHVVGIGAGAAIAWLAAAHEPQRIKSLCTAGSIHPLDLRRAIISSPWHFSNLLAMTSMFRLPKVLSRIFWGHRERIIARDLRTTTSLDYQRSAAFEEELQLRFTAMSIQSTATPVAKTSRYVVNVPPVRWATEKVGVPVRMFSDASALSRVLVRRGAKRCESRFSTERIPGARQRPHLEQPEAFVRSISAFAREVERNLNGHSTP